MTRHYYNLADSGITVAQLMSTVKSFLSLEPPLDLLVSRCVIVVQNQVQSLVDS